VGNTIKHTSMTILLEINKTPTVNITLMIPSNNSWPVRQHFTVYKHTTHVTNTIQARLPVDYDANKSKTFLTRTGVGPSLSSTGGVAAFVVVCTLLVGTSGGWLVVICDQCLDLQQSTPS
jgi:hypothetical protein